MLNAAKNKSRSPAGPMALRVLLLLVVALCLGQTRVWGFADTPQPASGVFESVTPSSNGENYDGCPYDASDSLLAAEAAPTGQFYSTAFEMKLAPTSYPGLSRGAHFQEANGALLRATEADAGVASSMQQLGVNLSRTPTGLAPRTSPAGWTWHHAPESGVMQLVPRPQHAPGSIFQPTLHPGGAGGYSIWGQ